MKSPIIRSLIVFGALLAVVTFPISAAADEFESILASPAFELPDSLKNIQPADKRPRDDESLSCAERFSGEKPGCLDESESPIVEYPLSKNCPAKQELKLVEAGECENPCRCQDLQDSKRASVVSCHHPMTQWACVGAEAALNQEAGED